MILMKTPQKPIKSTNQDQSPQKSETDSLQKARETAIANLPPEILSQYGEAKLMAMDPPVIRGLSWGRDYVKTLNAASTPAITSQDDQGLPKV